MRRVLQAFVAILLFSGPWLSPRCLAPCEGIVHDPQHRPVPGSEVVLKAQSSDYSARNENRC